MKQITETALLSRVNKLNESLALYELARILESVTFGEDESLLRIVQLAKW